MSLNFVLFLFHKIVQFWGLLFSSISIFILIFFLHFRILIVLLLQPTLLLFVFLEHLFCKGADYGNVARHWDVNLVWEHGPTQPIRPILILKGRFFITSLWIIWLRIRLPFLPIFHMLVVLPFRLTSLLIFIHVDLIIFSGLLTHKSKQFNAFFRIYSLPLFSLDICNQFLVLFCGCWFNLGQTDAGD